MPNLYQQDLKTLSESVPPHPFFTHHALEKGFMFHAKVSTLWSEKWRPNVTMSLYPFMDGKVEDFDPIFEELIKRSGDDPKILDDPDAYAEPFFPVAESLTKQAEEAEKSGDETKAKEFYLRAGTVYRISRFAIVRSEVGQKAWTANKDVYLRGGKYLDPPNQEVRIPFDHADTAAGDSKNDILAYRRIPKGKEPSEGWPVLMFICGLDAYRTDHTPRTDLHVQSGFACISLEIPGTGDCPAAKADPESPDRLWTSVLDWIDADPHKFGFNSKKICARGISTGGYYAFRIAHTHATRLVGVVGQGGWTHYALDPVWLRAMSNMEYPYALGPAFAFKLGYDSVEDLIKDNSMSKFSLLDEGILDKPSCRLLILNGMIDTIFPIEDRLLIASKGRVKDIRIMTGKPHMGNPGAEPIIYDWLNEVLAESKIGPKTWDA